MRLVACKALAGNSSVWTSTSFSDATKISRVYFFVAITVYLYIYISIEVDRELELMASASEIPRRDEEAPLVEDSSPVQPPKTKSHTKDVHILSLAFLLIFLAYGAAQNLQSTLNTVIISFSLFKLFVCLFIYLFFVSFLRISGGGLGNDVAWDPVSVFHVFLGGCFFGGAGSRIQDCFDYWDNWVLVVRGCELEAELVIANYLVLIGHCQ